MHKFFANLSKSFLVLVMACLVLVGCKKQDAVQSSSTTSAATTASSTAETTTTQAAYQVSDLEKAYLKDRFDALSAVNNEVVAYIYAPGTMLDEPVVQTTDNATYLDKTFDGGNEPYMGTVFMDMDNKKDFSDSLTWLFGHARGSQVPDHRMFNDVNYYDDQAYFDAHPYLVVETPTRKYYYEAQFLIIVPEDTAFYRTSFDSEEDFAKQLTEVEKGAHTKAKKVTINPKDKYLVLSTCREDDETIRSNLYLRQIPDEELTDFLAKHESELEYVNTRP